jgi:PAS domain S-box-containing protein
VPPDSCFYGRTQSIDIGRIDAAKAPGHEPFPMPSQTGGLSNMPSKKTARRKSNHATMEFLDAIIQGIPGIFYVLESNAKMIHWNANCETLTGRSAEEMRRMNVLEHIAHEDKDRVAAAIREAFAKGYAEAEANIVAKDGRKIPHRFTSTRMTVDDAAYVVGMGIDITRDMQAEEDRQKAEAEIRDLYDNAPCGYHSLDADGVILRINNTELAWLGYSREEVVGKKNFRELLTPQGVAVFEKVFPSLVKRGWAKDVQYEMRRKNGAVLPVLSNSSAIRDSQGNFLMSRAMLVDIACREQMENETRLQVLLDSTGQAIYGIDIQGRCTFCNLACLRVLGYDAPADLLGKNMHDLIHHSHANGTAYPAEECHIFRAFRQDAVVHIDDELLWRSDGTSFPAEYWSHPQKHGDTIIGAVVSFTDITERKRAEAELRKLMVAIEQSPTIIVITDRAGNIEYVNPKFTQVTGYTFEEVRGRNPRILKTDHTSSNAYERLWQTILAGHEWRGDFLNQKKSGEPYWERAVIAPVTDADGAITHFIAIKEDITLQKQSERELRNAEDLARRENAKLSAMISGMEEGIVFASANNVIIEINEYMCRLVNCRRDDVLGKRIEEIHEGHIKANILRQIDVFRRTLDAPPLVRERSLGPLDVILRMQPIYRNGVYDGVLLTVNDVTTLAQSRRAAEAAMRAKSMFLAVISHELRTPLNAIIGMTGLLCDTPLNAEQQDGFETIRNSGEILLSLINEILDFSKIEAGKMVLEAQPFDLVQCIEEAVDLVESAAARKRLAIVSQLAPDLSRPLIGDVARLRQILVNLLGNAVKFTSAGQISLSVSGEPHADGQYELHFAVRDTGKGITPNDQKLLFLSFSQISDSTKAPNGGTGLGLAISRRLAELMGGRMWVESSGIPDEGATFHFTVLVKTSSVPLADSGPTRGSIEAESRGTNPKRQQECIRLGLRVLLAEDNPVNQKVATKMLVKLGCHVDAVANGLEAFDAVQQVPYDVVLMDCQMPEVNGYEATRLIRQYEQERQRRPIRIIAMTAGAMQGDREECFLAGMNDYLSKPARLADFRRVLQPHPCPENSERADARAPQSPDATNSPGPAPTAQ